MRLLKLPEQLHVRCLSNVLYIVSKPPRMAEVLGVASALSTLICTAYTLCKTVHNTINRIRNTPRHIHLIAKDLEDFYVSLGTVQATLDNEDATQGILKPTTSENLTRVLQNSLTVFSDINAIVQRYAAQGDGVDLSTWQRLRWTYKEKEVEELRRRLWDHRMTLNMTISVASLYVRVLFNSPMPPHAVSNRSCRDIVKTSNATLHRSEATMLEIQEKLPGILQQLEIVKENQLPPPEAHVDVDRATLRTDYTYTLRHYLDDDNAVSTITEVGTPKTPSMQVSMFGASSSGITSIYRTAPTRIQSEGAEPALPEGFIQLFIKGITVIPNLVVQAESETYITEIKADIRRKVGLPRASFELAHAGRILASQWSLGEYNIVHGSTLICVSFRPNSAGEYWGQPDASCRGQGVSGIHVRTLNERTIHIDLTDEVTWAGLRSYVTSWICEKHDLSAGQCCLFVNGVEWKWRTLIHKPVLTPGDIMEVILVRLPPEDPVKRKPSPPRLQSIRPAFTMRFLRRQHRR